MSDKSWNDAWSDRYEQPASRERRRILPRLRRGGGSKTGRYAVLAAVVIAVVAAPFAVAASKGRFTAKDSRYTVLSRNTSNGDGGALAAACTSNKNTTSSAHEPCLNMVNKGTGYAAAFRTRGLQGFRLQTSGSGTATPFVLDQNATGWPCRSRRSEEHTSELQSHVNLVCRLLLEKKKKNDKSHDPHRADM